MAKTAQVAEPKITDTARAQLQGAIEDRLRQIMDEESKSHDEAFIDLALDALEFAPDSGEITDGPRDSGIDYYELTEANATIVQFKSQDLSTGLEWNRKFDPGVLADLRRIKDALLDLAHPADTASREVRAFLIRLADAVIQRKQLASALTIDDEEPIVSFTIDIYLVCLAKDLTAAAWEEFMRIQEPSETMFEGIKVYLNYLPRFSDALITAKWRQQNSGWMNIGGVKQERVELRCVDSHTDIIQTAKSCTFFTKAYDLVKAFRDLGYQIFEDNVRCELTTSKINKEIRRSLTFPSARRQFRDLNNGVTIICSNFTKPTANKAVVTLTKPGIINGLQTVKSLHDAYFGLKAPSDRADFENVTEVLVRVHMSTQFTELTKLITTTNNQNPMKPRNLRSNDAEQSGFQDAFASLGWFYARKEREWEAFNDRPSAWAKRLQGKRANSFKSPSGIRRVDNLDIAQSYFSFIGFTTEAMNKTKNIFDDDRIYAITFTRRINKHGGEYGYNFARSSTDILDNSVARPPTAEILLLSYLCRETARNLSQDQRQLREDSIVRLKLQNAPLDERNSKLKADEEYATQYILRGTVFIFTEVVGSLLFRAFGDGTYDAAKKLLRNGSLAKFLASYDAGALLQGHNNPDDNDIIMMLWDMYEDVIRSLVFDPGWLSRWQVENNLSRFHYSEETRRRILERVGELEKTVERRPLEKPWSAGPDKARGITKFLQQKLS